MARMLPLRSDSELAALDSKAEAVLYRALRDQLPDDMLVLHSFRWIRAPKGFPPEDAESDFVLLDPTAGILVIEVKGGGIEFAPETGWFSTDRNRVRRSIKDPFEQAKKGKYEILS